MDRRHGVGRESARGQPIRPKHEQSYRNRRQVSPPYGPFDKKRSSTRASPGRSLSRASNDDEASGDRAYQDDRIAREGEDYEDWEEDHSMYAEWDDFKNWVEAKLDKLEDRQEQASQSVDVLYGIVGKHEDLMSRQSFKVEALLTGKGKGKGRGGGYADINSAHRALQSLHSKLLALPNVSTITSIPRTIVVTVRSKTMDEIRAQITDEKVIIDNFIPPGRQSLTAMAGVFQKEFFKLMNA
eukprot:CAMPEP_0180541236 /NCGR_PEP_ID=MMETSP1036_2-20121128/67835_1 /TAXON_ID=632150 /ORGANISM="Azadinium spinosum, Strain 3D9" /LENGTH=240 /DNA_ID=CAMNT_0022556071 /DNA_START=56 /DNA_END=774 /DNA_ORIENTATION=+